ncbi:MAG: MerR family transcriptional regulator, partial [Desulfopila sp.]|nr:MerR family transcriptional regulator [Desulfopila sp.]
DDVELILKIKTLLHIKGYTIAGARKFLQSGAEIKKEVNIPDQVGTRQKLHRIKSELLDLYKQLEEKK